MEVIINKLYSYISRAFSRRALRAMAFLGLGWSLYYGWRLISFLEGNIIRRPRNLLARYGEGSHALILAPTTSIGRWFCIELARRSFNLILVGTDEGKMKRASNEGMMKRVANECRKLNPNIEIRVLIFDIQKANDETYYDLAFSRIKNLDISLLVQNTPFMRENFLKMNSQDIYQSLLRDCYSTMFLYRKIIPAMLGRANPSGVVIISGYQQWQAKELWPLMSATRRFRHFLSRSLAIEYGNKLDILSVSPFNIERDIEEEELPTQNGDESYSYSNILLNTERRDLNGLTRSFDEQSERENSRILGEEANEELRKKSQGDIVHEITPFWRRVKPRDFVIACLNSLSFEKQSNGHWKHDVFGIFG